MAQFDERVQIVPFFADKPLVRVVASQMVVTHVMLQVAATPWNKWRQTDHRMCHFSDDTIDDIPVGSVLGDGRVARIVAFVEVSSSAVVLVVVGRDNII